jgi:raffinose/stachyose/melibiose transport system permease protein
MAAASPLRAMIEIEIPVIENGDGLGFFFDCARAYEKAKPEVRVNLYGDPRISDKVRIRILEGTFPEITNAGGFNYWNLIRGGYILPLDEFLDSPNWEGDRTWRESFLPGTLDAYTYEGKVYGVPLPYYVMGLWYNKGMFEEHGWTAPRTWDEFFALCEQVKAAGVAPVAFQGRYPGYARMFEGAAFYQLGGADAYRKQQFFEPGTFQNPAYEEALRLVQKTALNCFQEGSMGMSHTEAQMQFFLSKAAMIPCGSWLKSEMLGKIPDGFRLGFCNMPAVPSPVGDPANLQIFSGYYFVMSKSPHARESVDFLRFMTSRAMAGLFCRQRDIPVAIQGANEGNLSTDMHDMELAIAASHGAYGGVSGEWQNEMNQYIEDGIFKLLTDTITPAALATELEGKAATVREHMAHPERVAIRHVWKPLILFGVMATMVMIAILSWLARIRAARRQSSMAGTAGRLTLGWQSALVFVAPAILLYSAFVVLPSVRSFVWSTREWDGLTAMKAVGVLNFKRLLFESDGFWTALNNNLFIMFVIPLFVIPLALFLATCISRGVRGSRLFRITFFFPNLLGGVAATLLWMHLYNPQGGVVNGVLTSLGFESFKGYAWLSQEKVHWLQDMVTSLLTAAGQERFKGWFDWLSQTHLYWALVPMSVWAACGFNMILFLAAMESIPPDLYEAAEIDGASHWRQFWTITLPLLWEVLSIAVVFSVIGGMKAFEAIWLLTNQAPTTQAHVIGTKMMQAMFMDFKVGEAAAIAVLLFVMVFFGSLATLRLMRREKVEM